MNAAKLVFATVTVISVIGAATFANAQTPNSAASAPAPAMQQPMSPSNSTGAAGSTDSTMNNRANTGTMNSTGNSTMGNTTGTRTPYDTTNTTSTERTARADRN